MRERSVYSSSLQHRLEAETTHESSFKVQRSHACMLYICSKRQPGHHYTYRASTHVQQLSDNQQRRLEAETTNEREERLQQRLQQLSAAQVRS